MIWALQNKVQAEAFVIYTDSESWFVLVNAPRHDPRGGVDWDSPGLADSYAERVLDIIESYSPGLRQKILGRAVFSPLDLERVNPNLVGGDQICGSHHLAQNLQARC